MSEKTETNKVNTYTAKFTPLHDDSARTGGELVFDSWGYPYQIDDIKFDNGHLPDPKADVVKVPKADFTPPSSETKSGIRFRTALVLVAGVYYLGHKARPYYKAWRYAKNHPDDPNVVQLKHNLWELRQNALGNVRNLHKTATSIADSDDSDLK